MRQSDIAARLDLIEASQNRIELALSLLVPPADERSHIADATATADQIDGLAAAAPLQAAQLSGIVSTLGDKLSDDELRDALENTLFITQQLSGIMQGTRADIVQMRATLLRLSALLEQVLRVRVEDDERGEGKAERRRIEDRRRAG